jgi:hypothetical protein
MSVPIPEYAGCLWPVDPACFSDEWAAMDADVQERALALASSTLHRLSGRRVTNCPITVRPNAGCAGVCFVPFTGFDPRWPIVPGMNVQGQWVNNCGPVCSNPAVSVRLPRPVGRVDEVKVDGAVVPPTDYRVMDGNMLVYIGSGAGWPTSQDATLPDTEDGTFSVTYINGHPPDLLAANAVGVLAMEYAKSCTGKKCRLPTGVTAIVRQGVAMEIDPGVFPNGTTGIREVDIWIGLWNPRNQEPSTILIPGLT